jgi:hypothetical protein
MAGRINRRLGLSGSLRGTSRRAIDVLIEGAPIGNAGESIATRCFHQQSRFQEGGAIGALVRPSIN